MDVLFLSVSTGGGHLKAAEAIKEYMEQIDPSSRTLIVDTLRYVNPMVDKLVVGSYLNTLKSTPQIYGKLYDMSETEENIYDFSETVNKLLSFKIKRLIYDFMPSVIVCTHPFSLQMVANLKKRNRIHIPIVAVLTDYVTHPFWLHDSVDAYVVPHEHIKSEMMDRGIREELVYPFGIPVSSCFTHRKNKALLMREFGLEDKLTILIMGGSLGFGEIKDTFLSLLGSKTDLQIIAVTGKNTSLQKQLGSYAGQSSKKVSIFSYTDRIADLMDLSDFIITKPGGMTISEALIKELPILMMSPIPGQEERNAHFLVNSGAAAWIMYHERLDSVLRQMIDNPLRVRHMKEIARYLAKPNAVNDIIGLLKRLALENKVIVGG